MRAKKPCRFLSWKRLLTPGKAAPVWIPAVLSVLISLCYLGFMVSAFPELSNDIQAAHWDDPLFIMGLLLFICAAFFIWPPWWLVPVAAVWAVYGIVMVIYRHTQKGAGQAPGKGHRKINGRTPEEELWFDER